MGAKARGIVFEADVSRDVMPSTTTLIDRSRFKNNGTWTNGAYTRLPSGLWVMDLSSGTSSVNITRNDSIEVGHGDFSFLLWFRHSESADNYLYSQHQNLDNRLYINACQAGDAGRINAYFRVGGAWLVIISTNNVYNDDNWHHLAIVGDRGNRGWAYVDGIDDTNINTCNSGDLSNTANIIFGSYAGIFYTGYIGIIKQYRFLLSPTAIYRIYNAERSLFGV